MQTFRISPDSFKLVKCILLILISVNVFALSNGQLFKEKLPKLANLTLDFNYSGDVAGIPSMLRQYDATLLILDPLGIKKSFSVNMDIEGATIADIIAAVSTETNNQVNLLYNESKNSLRISYTGVVDVGQNAVDESLKWQNGNNPRPILKQDGLIEFPYGEYQPIVTCEPLNLCDIELQAGEDIEGIVIGDSIRWNEGDQGVPVVYSGPANNLTPHLVLKPSVGGLETTLMVTTSRRTYMIKLRSGYNGYVARAGFYYPAEMIQHFESNKEQLSNNLAITANATNPDMELPLINLSKANYNYSISNSDYPWKPTQVFDDGTSVYIQMPNKVDSLDLPGICVLVEGTKDKCEMVNFRYNNHFYIVDKLFNKAKLINGFNNYMQTITITRNPDKTFWQRVFGN